MIERSASNGNQTHVLIRNGHRSLTFALAESPAYGSIPQIPLCSDTTPLSKE